MILKLVAWNVKGLCNTLRHIEVKNFIRNNNISFCGIIETQLRKKFVDKVCGNVFGGWNWCTNSVDCSKGCRIAVGWDSFVVSAQLLSQTNQVMHFLVKSLGDNKQMFVSVVYGENSPRDRIQLWANLVDHNRIAGNDPWVMFGDFNVILNFNEHSNGPNVRGEGMKEFADCVEELNMEDINMNGMFYTWTQKMRDPSLGILKKLDRVMGNYQFVAAFPTSFAQFMPYLSSDHCPAVLSFPDISVSKPKTFRFLNFLAGQKEFSKVVKENWDIDVEGYDMFKLAKKLKYMKKFMRDLNKKKWGCV